MKVVGLFAEQPGEDAGLVGEQFILLAVELAVGLNRTTSLALAAVFFLVSVVFVWRSFYGMRITSGEAQAPTAARAGGAAAKRTTEA